MRSTTAHKYSPRRPVLFNGGKQLTFQGQSQGVESETYPCLRSEPSTLRKRDVVSLFNSQIGVCLRGK